MINNARVIRIRKAKRKRKQIISELTDLVRQRTNSQIRITSSDKHIHDLNSNVSNLINQLFDVEKTLRSPKNSYINKIHKQHLRNDFDMKLTYTDNKLRILFFDEKSLEFGYSFKNMFHWSEQDEDCYKIIKIPTQEFLDKFKKEKDKDLLDDEYASTIAFPDIYNQVKYHAYFSFRKLNTILSDTKENLQKAQIIIKDESFYLPSHETADIVKTNCIDAPIHLIFQSFEYILACKFV